MTRGTRFAPSLYARRTRSRRIETAVKIINKE